MINRLVILLISLHPLIGQDVIGEGLYEEELINFLKENYKTSTTLGYTNARDVLYSEIEKVDGVVKGVYTNYAVELPDGVDPSTYLYENGINCEHVWPRSMYEGEEPTKSDMHTLRPCKDNVNSARGNKPFNEITDSQTNTWYWLEVQTSNTPSSNIDEYSENYGSYFEPREDRKGDIARTMFYFYSMYSDIADEDFFEIQKEVLRIWHNQDPTNADEINRTWAISYYQENKPNPFILDPSLIERAYFYEGYILGDVNEDETINVLDIVSLIDIILNEEQINFLGDMNSDGENNILDVVILASIILE